MSKPLCDIPGCFGTGTDGDGRDVECQNDHPTKPLFSQTENDLMRYHIWSNEHKGWWGPGHRGYCVSIEHAGVYTEEQANAICWGANYAFHKKEGGMANPNEIAVPVGSVGLGRAPGCVTEGCDNTLESEWRTCGPCQKGWKR